ncbi:MAG: hypothetical protein RLZZ574_1531 [Cyanobacteriota bacterium]|jgi:hypothetical protein
MVQVWQAYQTDLGRVYPMFALSINQVNDVATDINPIDLLPNYVLDNLIEIGSPCAVAGLTPRKLALWLSDGAQFLINYPVPWSTQLAQDLTSTVDIVAWEFIGERLKYGRLRKILDNAI